MATNNKKSNLLNEKQTIGIAVHHPSPHPLTDDEKAYLLKQVKEELKKAREALEENLKNNYNEHQKIEKAVINAFKTEGISVKPTGIEGKITTGIKGNVEGFVNVKKIVSQIGILAKTPTDKNLDKKVSKILEDSGVIFNRRRP